MFKNIKGIHINEYHDHKHLTSDVHSVTFLQPEYIYVPLVESATLCEAKVSVGDDVKVGQAVALRTGRFSLPLHSSVSGTVTSINKKMWHASGKMVECIEIKNDFKETLYCEFKPVDTSNLSKEDIINVSKNCGIVGLGGSGFPSYVKYSGNANIDMVIINAAECEPFITADYRLIIEKTDKLINGIKYIMKATGATSAKIAIKHNKEEAINALTNAIKDENISLYLLKDVYPAGWEKYIVEHITKKRYNSLPSEVGVVVNNVATAIALCDAVEYNKPLIEKMVTFTGYALNEPKNVYVKVGSLASDVIKFLGGYKEGITSANFVAGGLMTGNSIPFDTLVINRSLGSIIVNPIIDTREDQQPCMGCGACSLNCPTSLTPTEIKRALDYKDVEKIKLLKANKCIQCGLCSYVCPSRIDLTDAVSKAKALMMKR